MRKEPETKSPRRILYVENGIGYGGAVICLRHLVRNLDRARFEPMVITGRTGPDYEEIAAEATWKHIPDRRINTVALKNKLRDAGWSRRIPAMYFILNQLLSRLDDIGNFLPHFLQLLWAAIRFRPALIHANNEPLCNRAAVFSGKLLRVPVICHVRGDLGPAVGGSRMLRWLYQLPNHFIPVSHWISEGIAATGVPPEKRTVVYDGIGLDDMDTNADGGKFRHEYDIPGNAFAVGLVGLLIPWKGQDLFLDAASRLASKIPGLKMVIVGGTPEECATYEQELRMRVSQEGLDDVVIFTGHVSEMPAVYNGLDVVVSASTTPEPLGTVVIECMTMARPLVAPNHGGAAEMAEDDRTALLFIPGDSDSLADAIQRLYSEDGLGKHIGMAAREKALARFSVDNHVQHVQNIYDSLLYGGKARCKNRRNPHEARN